MIAAVCLILHLSIVICVDHEVLIVRQSYGTVFEYQGILDNSIAVWYHTFVIPMKSIQIPQPYVSISTDSNTEIHRTILKQRKDLLSEIKNLENICNTIIPPAPNGRSKSGLINFIGKAAKSLFGTAMDSDVQALEEHVSQFARSNIHIEGQLHTFQKSMKSMMTLMDKRTQLSDKAISLLHERLNLINTFTRDAFQELAYDNVVNSLLQDIVTHMNSELRAIQTLLTGYLPINFVPPQLLQNILTNITESLTKFGQFRLVHNDILHYYNIQDITFVRKEKNLFLQLKVPVSTTNMELYIVLHHFQFPWITNRPFV
jgi:hypothetical protein